MTKAVHIPPRVVLKVLVAAVRCQRIQLSLKLSSSSHRTVGGFAGATLAVFSRVRTAECACICFSNFIIHDIV